MAVCAPRMRVLCAIDLLQALNLVKDGGNSEGSRRGLSTNSRDRLRRGSRESLNSAEFDTNDDVSTPTLPHTSPAGMKDHAHAMPHKRTLTRT